MPHYPSSYPTGLDSHAINHVDSVNEIVHADDVNGIADATNKIELELGVNPSGAYADVAAAIAAFGAGAIGVVYSLAAGSAVGATTITIDRTPPTGYVSSQTWLVIGAYTATAELRKINSITGSAVIVLGALTYAHSADDLVVVVRDSQVSPELWGCKGDGSTDDAAAFQEASFQAAVAALTLDGQSKTYITSLPQLAGSSSHWARLTLRAKTTFAPADTNNALVMCYQGATRSFTADAATDTITTSSAHGIPAEGIPVVLKAGTMPGGLTVGKLYYAYNRGASTFQVSAAKTVVVGVNAVDSATINVVNTMTFPSSGSVIIAGATVTYTGKTATSLTGCGSHAATTGNEDVHTALIDITSAGSGGTAYCEVHSLTKNYMREVTLDGNNVAGLNGIYAPVQQQSSWDIFRVNNCPGYGIAFNGQQADLRNIEVINCGDSVIFDNMSFLYCKDLNCEQFSGSAMKTQAIISTGGLSSSLILGFHFESRDTAGVFADFTVGGIANCIFDCGSMSGFNTDTSAWVGFDMGSASLPCSYEIRRLRFPQGTPSAPSAIAVRDNYLLKTIHVWNDTSGTSCNRELAQVSAGNVPTSGSYLDESGGHTVLAQGGREFRVGSQNNSLPWMVVSAGSALTGDLLVCKDTAAATQFQITKDGWTKIGGGTALKALTAGATSVADGGTVTHGLGTTPTLVRATPSVAGEMVSVTTLGTTTFTVGIKKHDGTAGTTQTIYWEALKV